MSSEENASSVQDPGVGTEAQVETTTSIQPPPEMSEVGNLLETMEGLSPVVQGSIVQGKILRVTAEEVLVDIGLKSEASVPRAEFLTDDGQLTVAAGDVVDVWVESYDEATGAVSVTRKKAARLKAWEEIERAYREQTTLRGRVVDRIKGGLTVDIGVRAFLPGSHADTRQHCDLDALKGQEIDCKVITVDRKRDNIVVSRKLVLEEEQNLRKAELLKRLVEGAELTGRVKNLTDYGVFVDLGGMDGLLHITDLSWGRVGHPSEVVQVGQEIKVKVLKYDREKDRVSLGLKQLAPDPWEQIPSKYHPGDRVEGRVVSLSDYGAFVELEPGVEGLSHISEMTWSKRLRHPSKVVKVGDHVQVAVLAVDGAQRRISLSLKHTLPDPWQTLAEKLSVGSLVEGRVRNLTAFGAFVEVEDGVDGLIHLSNLSWAKDVKHPSEILKKGQKIQAVVLGLDVANRRLSLGIKQLQPDIWGDFFAKTKTGDIVRGKVSRLVKFGAFVELQEGIEGLCHYSEFGDDHDPKGSAHPEVGHEYDFRVIRLTPEERKIGLSLKTVKENAEPRAEQRPEQRTSVFGEAIEKALAKSVAQSSASEASEDPAPSPPSAENES